MEKTVNLKKVNNYTESYYLFHLWRAFDLVAAMFSMFGIIFSTLDYEKNYSADRNYYNCEEYHLHTEIYRNATMISSIVSLLFIIFRHYYKGQWLSVLQKIEKPHKSGFQSNKKRNSALLIEVLILSIFPYPNFSSYFYLPLRHNFETISICYTVAEILYCCMFLRFFFVFRAISNYSQFQDDRARLYCGRYEVQADISFAFKCLLVKHPWKVIISVALVNLLISAVVYRVFERPLDGISNMFYSDPMEAIWYIFENVSTLGYGELFPYSYPARAISVLSYMAGAALFTLIIVKMQQLSELNPTQDQALESISKSKIAAKVLRLGIYYLIIRKKHGIFHPLSITSYVQLRNSIENFKRCRVEIKSTQSKENHFSNLKTEIELSRIQIRACKEELESFIDLFTKNF